MTSRMDSTIASGDSSDFTEESSVQLQRRDTDLVAEQVGVPHALAEVALVSYRSTGVGAFAAVARFCGMPLEKLALFMNSSQVTGRGQLRQALALTFRDGLLAPYRVVGSASLVAWFLQYSIMGAAFQTVDHSLSRMLGVKPVYYGHELMQASVEVDASKDYRLKSSFKAVLSPILAAGMETQVSNRAEVQRFFGKAKFAMIEEGMKTTGLRRLAGPAFAPCFMRNLIMCQTTFVLTPVTYKIYFPQEQKSKTSLFWYGLGMNIFVGNMVAITQQALWGRSLDHLATHGRIQYSHVIKDGLAKDGISAFFSTPRWFSRVLMNCPVQGSLPYFYNEILPLGEYAYLSAIRKYIYEPFQDELEKELELFEEMRLERRATIKISSECEGGAIHKPESSSSSSQPTNAISRLLTSWK